jgi:hypothetical protein
VYLSSVIPLPHATRGASCAVCRAVCRALGDWVPCTDHVPSTMCHVPRHTAHGTLCHGRGYGCGRERSRSRSRRQSEGIGDGGGGVHCPLVWVWAVWLRMRVWGCEGGCGGGCVGGGCCCLLPLPLLAGTSPTELVGCWLISITAWIQCRSTEAGCCTPHNESSVHFSIRPSHSGTPFAAAHAHWLYPRGASYLRLP